MPRARHRAAIAALQVLLGVSCLLLVPSAAAYAQGPAGRCEEAAGFAVLPSPLSPWKGAPLRVFAVTEKPMDGVLSLIAPNGSAGAKVERRYAGPPYIWYAEIASPAAGIWHIQLKPEGGSGCGTLSRDIMVHDSEPPRPRNSGPGVWPIRGAWDRAAENLYAAWIEKLFDAPLEEAPSWKALHEVLRDRSRNALFNHLGLGEDQTGMTIKPDCADLPYFLRAYFAFKMGLPFGYSKCNRGGGGQPPRCGAWYHVLNPEDPRAREAEQGAASEAQAQAQPQPQGGGLFGLFREPAALPKPVSKPPAPHSLSLVGSFGQYLPVLADAVHSGSARTAANDNNTDYYPVPLSQETLRPGTIYADPYGHVLMLVKRVPQTDAAAGVFLAVDGQPDGTVARKRFWRGNFLFAQDPGLGGPGFKRFRPIFASEGGGLHRLTNAEIAKNTQYGDFSLDQSRMSIDEFYDRMDDVMSPEPLDPARAMKAVIDALEEQVKARVTSVENGRKWQLSGKGDAEMPEGWTIFEAAGAWEDFATPSRDLRLLIAIDVVRGFPDRVSRRPDRYAMPGGQSVAEVKAGLEDILASELSSRTFSYPRTDGSLWTLALKDVVARAPDLEMAYNLNDCVELRWGAAAGSEEASTCRRHAPASQRARMSQYREWFHERRRPARGAG